MIRTRGSSTSDSPPSVAEPEGEARFHCPFKGFDDCVDGVRGSGYTRFGSLLTHMRSKHYPNEERKSVCRCRISNISKVYKAWEDVLRQTEMWLCHECMRVQVWKNPCRTHPGVVTKGPFNGIGADFLIHDIPCPVDAVPDDSPPDNGVVSDPLPLLNLEFLDHVLQQQIPTVSCIPVKCKLYFARTFNTAIQKVIRSPRDITLWVQLLLLPICVLRVYVPKSSQEEHPTDRKKLQVAAINSALSVWSDTHGCARLVHQVLEEHKALQDHLQKMREKQKLKNNKKDKQEAKNLSLCRKKMRHGMYTAAIRTLTSNGVDPTNSDTLEGLRCKHPYAAPPKLPADPPTKSALIASQDLVLSKIKSFPKGTSCGRDGLRAQHLLDALSGSAAAISDELVCSITALVNIFLAGLCPKELGVFIASAPLTPLIKPGGGLRPIAVGTVWRRLVSKVAAAHAGKEMESYLGDYQFGVGVACGGESILHSVNRMLEVHGGSDTRSMVLVDFSNAFNMVNRTAMLEEIRKHCPSISYWVEFCYAAPAKLYYMNHTLESAQGVQQGDPLGPLLFAMTLHPLIHSIVRQCDLELQAWYLDDGTMIGDTVMVAKALGIIQKEGPGLGLYLNVAKTQIFWPTVDVRSLASGLFPEGIYRPDDGGVELLGGPVSLDDQFCSNFVAKKVQKTIDLIEAVKKLKDPQSELLLLRNCSGVSRLYFCMRTAKPAHLKIPQPLFDDHLYAFLRFLITGDGPGFGRLQQRLATLPIQHGGLGVYTMHDTMHYAYVASCLQTIEQQNNILRLSGVIGLSPSLELAINAYNSVCGIAETPQSIDHTAPQSMRSLAVKYFGAVLKDLPTNYTLSPRDKALWQSNRFEHAQDYLMALPIEGLNQKLGPRQFSSVLCYRLGIPLFEPEELCSLCGDGMDIHGDHAVHCAREPGLKFRHDLVRDTIFDMCYRASVSVRKEAALGLLSDEGADLRPADILVYGWEGGRDVCMDVIGVSPFTGEGVKAFKPGQALENAMVYKKKKYFEKCTEHGLGLGVLAFTTLGELGCDTMDFLIETS